MHDMVRIVIDQSYQTHVQTSVISCSKQYCNTQVHPRYWTEYCEHQDTILLEDYDFDRIITQIRRYTQDPCTVTQFKHIINREIALHHQEHYISTQIMTFLISETRVEEQIVQSPWGRHGHIMCHVQLLLLKSKKLPRHIINDCKHGKISIVPKSLYTIEFLTHATKRQNYALVYLQEHYVKCIIIRSGQIVQLQYLNRGLEELQQIMQQMHVGQYYRHHDIHINQLTRNLIIKSAAQYTTILGQWLSQYMDQHSSVAVINELVDHELINEQINKQLGEQYGRYVMECSRMIPRTSRRGDVDVHAYLCQHNEI